jgi:hypothetical protein
MKQIHTLLFAGALAAGFVLATQAKADTFLSPRAQASQTKTVSDAEAGVSLASGHYLGAGLRAANLFLVSMPGGTEATPNLVSGQYAGAAARNPARELSGAQFEIAPVAEPGTSGQPSCCHAK